MAFLQRWSYTHKAHFLCCLHLNSWSSEKCLQAKLECKVQDEMPYKTIMIVLSDHDFRFIQQYNGTFGCIPECCDSLTQKKKSGGELHIKGIVTNQEGYKQAGGWNRLGKHFHSARRASECHPLRTQQEKQNKIKSNWKNPRKQHEKLLPSPSCAAEPQGPHGWRQLSPKYEPRLSLTLEVRIKG